MALVTITARVDAGDKAAFDRFCEGAGLNTSTVINPFVKVVLRENRIPFELSWSDSDPFFSDSNLAYIKKPASELRAGKGRPHELIE